MTASTPFVKKTASLFANGAWQQADNNNQTFNITGGGMTANKTYNLNDLVQGERLYRF